MLRKRVITATASAVTLAAATLASGVAASPANAAGDYVGEVNSNRGLIAHPVPSSGTPRSGSYGDGTRLRLLCKVRSVSIGGNDVWYLVRGSKERWVSARYVDNIGAAPERCGDGFRSKAYVDTARLNRREGPTLRTAVDGVLQRNARVSVVCWIEGLGEGTGDSQWYQLTSGSWVSAKYISPTKRRVEICR